MEEFMKIFTITHKQFTPPQDALYVPLHVGHIRFTDGSMPPDTADYGYMGDDTGENISAKNNLYGELTGLYWIWKNCPHLDYAGLVHYRRYFADESGRLLTEQGFRQLFSQYDVIIGRHIEYDISYAEKFAQYHHREDLEKTGRVIQRLYPAYYEDFQAVIHDNKQYVFNLFAAPKPLLDAYAKWLFDICFALEDIIDVSSYDQYRARIYGFLAEELLFVWIRHNRLRYYEAPVIYSQEKAETIEFKKALKQCILQQGYKAAHELFLKTFRERPDLTLEDADFSQELRLILTQLNIAERYPKDAVQPKYYAEQLAQLKQADNILKQALHIAKNQTGSMDKADFAYLAEHKITWNMLSVLIELDANYTGFEEQTKQVLLSAMGMPYEQYMQQVRLQEPVSVVVLYYSESGDTVHVGDMAADAGLCNTLDSIQRQQGCRIECVIADALGTAAPLAEKMQQLYNEVDEVRMIDFSGQQFDTAAQLKNAVVWQTGYDTVVFVTAGTVLEKDALRTLLLTEELLPEAGFDALAVKDDNALDLLAVNRSALSKIGGWNELLSSAEDYELLLRACDWRCTKGFRAVYTQNSEKPVFMETYLTYAYILGKYAKRLQQADLFNQVFSMRYEQAQQYGIADYFTKCAEEMVGQTDAFLMIDEKTRPVLVLRGEQVCYGVLDIFAEQFAQALIQCGQNVWIADIQKEQLAGIMALSAKKFKAAVGFQTAVFTTSLPEDALLGNFFDCPKFNFVFDHPLYISYHLMLPLRRFYVLAQDTDYAQYVKRYLKKVCDAYHLPPAGQQGKLVQSGAGIEKIYDISFIGTYNDFRERLRAIRELAPQEQKRAGRLLKQMRRQPNRPIEQVFLEVLHQEGISEPEPSDFAVSLHRMMNAGRAVLFYYREKIISTLLEAGLTVHVFSESWEKSPFAAHPGLIIHEAAAYEESLDIMAQSRISLNIMSWHKGGMTERVANAMLNRSVCVTDQTSYLTAHFCDGQDIVLFDLEQIQALPDKLGELLSDEEKCSRIAQAGYEKALKEHTWSNRAKRFMEILTDIEK